VAVDHIVQAARVAYVDDAELAALETGFVGHAVSVVAELRREQAVRRRCLHVVQVKNADELEGDFFSSYFWDNCGGLTFLVSPESRSAVETRLGDLDTAVRVRDFDAIRENLSTVLREVLARNSGEDPGAARLALVAPFYFLKRDGICETSFDPGICYQGIKIFANNYTVQDVKIKACKGTLNQAYRVLTHLSPETLAGCPFLGRRGCLYVADLGFIPEQYRIDVPRAEKILNRCLRRWLDTIREHLQSA
jgi:hypothetical protein